MELHIFGIFGARKFRRVEILKWNNRGENVVTVLQSV